MDITIDKFGRITLPKSLRVLLGLTPGKKVNIQITDEGFVAKPVTTPKVEFIEEKGFVYLKYITDSEEKIAMDLDVILKEVREERIDKFLMPLK